MRQGLRALSLDALVISHLPNIRYLTGLNGTAGLVVLTMSSCTLLVDFRYKSAAQALVRESGMGELVTVTIVPQGYDESLVAAIRETGARRIGVEAAWLPVSRFNKLSSALAAAAPTPLQSPLAPPALVPTERVIESVRLVKDEREIATLKEAGRRLADAVAPAISLVQAGKSELRVAAEVDALLREVGFERPAFETIVASGPNSAPSARAAGRARCVTGRVSCWTSEASTTDTAWT